MCVHTYIYTYIQYNVHVNMYVGVTITITINADITTTIIIAIVISVVMRTSRICVRMHAYMHMCLGFLWGSSVELGTTQRRLAWPLRKDDTHNSRSVNNFMHTCMHASLLLQIILHKSTVYLNMILEYLVTDEMIHFQS